MKKSPAPKFQSQLAPDSAKIVGGFGSGGKVCPSKWATELFKGEMSGPWLCCYMLRRFGWPNSGSDDYKELCSWTITTPMAGLFLSVSPYMGHGGTANEIAESIKFGVANLHFGVRFTDAIEKELHREPSLLADFRKRENAALLKWWKNTGRNLYTFGSTMKTDPDETLVKEWGANSKRAGEIWGLWKRRKEHKRSKFQMQWLQKSMAFWWLEEFIKEKHPEVRLPKFTKRIREGCSKMTRVEIQIRSAVRAALSDLLKPTNVRDIYFTPFGDIERADAAKKRYTNQPSVSWFNGAGNTPEYWYVTMKGKPEKS